VTVTTNSDLHRDFGRMEGQIKAMDDRLSRIEEIVERIDTRLASIETHENQLRGAWWVLAGIATIIGVVIGIVVNHFWK